MKRIIFILSLVFSLFICSSVVLGASGFMYGESFEGGCFLSSNHDLPYGNISSLNVTVSLFNVNSEFYSDYGSHIGEVDSDNDFGYTLYCNNFLNVTSDSDYSGNFTNVFYTSVYVADNPDKDQAYGSHVFPSTVDESLYEGLSMKVVYDLYKGADKPPGGGVLDENLISYVEENTYRGDCPKGWECIAKVSPYNTANGDFSNSHVWACNVSFDTDMYSICYKPIYRTNCNATDYELNDSERTCDWPGWRYVQVTPAKSEWLYCSFGMDDVQYPAYDPDNASDGHEDGHCCPSGTYYNKDDGLCKDAEQLLCGFGSGKDCGVNENNLFTLDYFNDPGCFDDFWVTRDDWPLNRTSCCKDVEGYGGVIGNFRCYVRETYP